MKLLLCLSICVMFVFLGCVANVSEDEMAKNRKEKSYKVDISTYPKRHEVLKDLYWVIDAEIENMKTRRAMKVEFSVAIAELYQAQAIVLLALQTR